MTESIRNSNTYNLAPLWFGIWAGPVMWTLHLLLSYFLASLFCLTGFFSGNFFGLNGASALVLLVTLVAALVVLFAGWLAYGRWRQMKDNTLTAARTLPGFMALSGVLFSSLFFLAILMTGLPALFLSPCR